jgi:hypothetical protein
MSSNAYDAPLRFEWRPSRWLRIYRDLSHALALCALLLPVALPAWLRAVLILAVIGSWGWQSRVATRRRARQLAGSWVWQADGRWQRQVGGRCMDYDLLAPAVVLPWLIVLRLRTESRRPCYILLFPDAVQADVWRHLQVRLRQCWAGQGADQEPG